MVSLQAGGGTSPTVEGGPGGGSWRHEPRRAPAIGSDARGSDLPRSNDGPGSLAVRCRPPQRRGHQWPLRALDCRGAGLGPWAGAEPPHPGEGTCSSAQVCPGRAAWRSDSGDNHSGMFTSPSAVLTCRRVCARVSTVVWTRLAQSSLEGRPPSLHPGGSQPKHSHPGDCCSLRGGVRPWPTVAPAQFGSGCGLQGLATHAATGAPADMSLFSCSHQFLPRPTGHRPPATRAGLAWPNAPGAVPGGGSTGTSVA